MALEVTGSALVALTERHPVQGRPGVVRVRTAARRRLAPPPERPEEEKRANHERNYQDSDKHPASMDSLSHQTAAWANRWRREKPWR